MTPITALTAPDGPQKKFYLIKYYSDVLPQNRRELSCAELVAIIRKAASRVMGA